MRKIKLSLVIGLVFIFAGAAIAYGQLPIRVVVDGKVLVSDTAPIIVNDRVMVPLRAVSESLGATVTWDAADQKVTITSAKPKTVKVGDDTTTWPYWIKDGDLYLEYHNALEFVRECKPHPTYVAQYFKTNSRLAIGGVSYDVPYLDQDGYRLISMSHLQRHRILSFTWDAATATLQIVPQ